MIIFYDTMSRIYLFKINHQWRAQTKTHLGINVCLTANLPTSGKTSHSTHVPSLVSEFSQEGMAFSCMEKALGLFVHLCTLFIEHIRFQDHS